MKHIEDNSIFEVWPGRPWCSGLLICLEINEARFTSTWTYLRFSLKFNLKPSIKVVGKCVITYEWIFVGLYWTLLHDIHFYVYMYGKLRTCFGNNACKSHKMCLYTLRVNLSGNTCRLMIWCILHCHSCHSLR